MQLQTPKTDENMNITNCLNVATQSKQECKLGKGDREKWSENTGIAKKGGGCSDPAKIFL